MTESMTTMRAMAMDGDTPHEWVLVREDEPDNAIAWFGWSTNYVIETRKV